MHAGVGNGSTSSSGAPLHIRCTAWLPTTCISRSACCVSIMPCCIHQANVPIPPPLRPASLHLHVPCIHARICCSDGTHNAQVTSPILSHLGEHSRHRASRPTLSHVAAASGGVGAAAAAGGAAPAGQAGRQDRQRQAVQGRGAHAQGEGAAAPSNAAHLACEVVEPWAPPTPVGCADSVGQHPACMQLAGIRAAPCPSARLAEGWGPLHVRAGACACTSRPSLPGALLHGFLHQALPPEAACTPPSLLDVLAAAAGGLAYRELHAAWNAAHHSTARRSMNAPPASTPCLLPRAYRAG
jgi:hypothetical protein